MSISDSIGDDNVTADRLRQLLGRSPVQNLSPEQARNVLTQFIREAVAQRSASADEFVRGLSITPRLAWQVFLTAGPMPPWQTYQAYLEALDADSALMTQVRAYWRAAMASAAAPRAGTQPGRLTPLTRPFQPVVVTKDEELTAATPAEFADLLRQLRVRSGVGPSEIARRSQIARSQVYELIKAGRSGLPTRAPQVMAFARACGLSPDKADILMALWSELAEHAMPGEPADSPPPVEPVPGDRPVATPARTGSVVPPPALPVRQRTPVPLVGWAVLGLVAIGVVIAVLLVCHATTLSVLVATAGAVLLPVIVILVAIAFLIPISRALAVISNIDIEYRPSRSTGRWSYRLAMRSEPRPQVKLVTVAPDRDAAGDKPA